jgi:type III restriction enzyme
MSQVVIENPVINSPFEEPARHFRFDEQGITNTIVPERRISQYFVPIAKPRKTAKERQLTFDEWTEDRIEENKTVNAIRQLIQLWREGRYTDDVSLRGPVDSRRRDVHRDSLAHGERAG